MVIVNADWHRKYFPAFASLSRFVFLVLAGLEQRMEILEATGHSSYSDGRDASLHPASAYVITQPRLPSPRRPLRNHRRARPASDVTRTVQNTPERNELIMLLP